MPSFAGNANLATSGLGGSISITSAPSSRSVRAQSGPARTREKSTTRMPLKGPPMSAPLEFGETRSVLPERCEAGFKILRGPDRFLNLRYRQVGRQHALIGRQICQLLGCRVGDCGPESELLRDRQRRLLERFIGDDEVDQAPALERRGVVAPREHRHLLRPSGADALDLSLDSTHQRMQS